MTRAPWDLTPRDNPHDRAWLARGTARRIVREVIHDRARTDPGPTGDWCREMVAEEQARKFLAMQEMGRGIGDTIGRVVEIYRSLGQGIAEGIAAHTPKQDQPEGQHDDAARGDTDRPADRDPDRAPPGADLDR